MTAPRYSSDLGEAGGVGALREKAKMILWEIITGVGTNRYKSWSLTSYLPEK